MISQQSPSVSIRIQLQCYKHFNQSSWSQSIISESQCIDYSISFDMTVIQNSTVIDVEDASYCVVIYASGQWRSLSLPNGIGVSAGWSLLCSIDLELRSNNKYNTPPVAIMISPRFIPVGISQTIIIPTMDADNDQVRCRFASTTAECASVCPPNSLPIGTIMFSNCTLLITGSNVADWYAVAIVIEDFIDSTAALPLSTIPVQFLINVQQKSSCPYRPLLTGPTTSSDQCIGIKVGTSFNIELIAENFCPNSTKIKDIAILSFRFLTKTPIVQNTTVLWSVLLTWTPAAVQVGSQILCAIAIDSTSMTSSSLLEELTTHHETFNTTNAVVVVSSPVCNSLWPWPWLAPVLSALGTLLLDFIFCCCCYRICCSRKRPETRSIATNTSFHQDGLIDLPTHSYTIYNAFEYEQNQKQSSRSSLLKRKAIHHSTKSSRRTSRVTPASTSVTSSVIDNHSHHSIPTKANAYIFGDRAESK
ncbi:unnamed protein product [Adineta steineri]|uniref:Uncharacterized protein n=1 Tax=Adineta steineri TaxID=433720 RepID=A0A815SGL1_9BILA|nr:unnamed protein product [Adineta steineri]CAF1640586.1 unnamed protein product [Adineta steineri]